LVTKNAAIMPGLGRSGGLGFAATMPEFHLTDLRIIDPFVHKTVVCILPFF
jgi:hypothetical protein